VQKFAENHGLSIDEAERILKQRAGLGGNPTELGTLLAALKPEPSPIEEAVSKALASRIENMATSLFPNPQANTGGGTPQAALSEALKQAKAAGAQSLYLPDGTMVNLAGGNNQEGSMLKNATEKIQKYVTDIIDSRLSGVFNPPPGPVVGDYSNNPEVAKLVFEDKWKEEDRKAQDARALRRDGAIRDIAAVIGAAFSPEGYKKLQKLLKEGPTGEAGTGKKEEIETKREAKLLKTTCWQCMRVFPYEEGQDPVCPYCGQAQNVQCPKCEKVFIPRSPDRIVCPNCHTQLQTKPEEQGKPSSGEGEGAPEESSASISVGQGILE